MKWRVLALSALVGCGTIPAQAEVPVTTTSAPPTTIVPIQLDRPAVATKPAVRITLPTTTVPAQPLGLQGLPFAPVGLDACSEMGFYRQQWGLPPVFDQLGYRESRCLNRDDVKTFCCHGYWQLYTSLHLRDHRLAPKLAACEVRSHHDLNSDDPLEKQKQACAARALYDVVGLEAWAL